MNIRCLVLISLLTVGLTMHGCKKDAVLEPTPPITITQEIEIQGRTASATPYAPAKPSATLTIPKAILATPQATLTSTTSVTPIITLTPLPTMDKRGLLELIDDNGGCQLPCWWGIEPGKTTAEQALAFIKQFATKIDSSGPINVEVDGKVRSVIGYWIEYPLPGSTKQGKFHFYLWDGIVTSIAVGPETTQYRFTIDQLLSKMGKPSQVYLQAKHDAMGYTVPFKLILYYPDRRFFANYYIEAENLGDNIRACPAKVAPGLILWGPEYKMENRLADEMLGPDSKPGFQTLRDATGLSIDDFFAIFSQAGFSDCLESPLAFWENLK